MFIPVQDAKAYAFYFAVACAITLIALTGCASNRLLDCLDTASALEMKCEDEHPLIKNSCEAVFIIRVYSCRAEARDDRCR